MSDLSHIELHDDYDFCPGYGCPICESRIDPEEEDMLDPHDVWSPSEFRSLLEAAFTKALAEERFGRGAAERKAKRRALALHGARQAPVQDTHRLEATPSIPATEDYFSAAPRCLGEEQDLAPDTDRDEWWKVSDAKLIAATVERGDDPVEALQARIYMERKNALLPSQRADWDTKEEWRLAGFAVRDRMEEADEVVWRTQDELVEDKSHSEYLLRDDSPAPRGFGMTVKEFRRKWYMDARLRYEQMLTQALAFHRAKTAEDKNKIKRHKILKSQADTANAVLAKWRFVDELQRHGLFDPDAATIERLKAELTVGFKRNYANAYMELSWRTKLAERGQYDRYLTPLS